MLIKISNEYTLHDIKIVPQTLSKINSRRDVNVCIDENKKILPIISSPMAYFTHFNILALKPENRFFIYTLPRIAPNKELLYKGLLLSRINKATKGMSSIYEELNFLDRVMDYNIIEEYSNSYQLLVDIFDEINFSKFYNKYLNYNDIDVRIKVAKILNKFNIEFIPTIGLNDYYKDKEKTLRLIELSNTGFYLIDIANGYMERVLNLLKDLSKSTNKIPIFGNIISSIFMEDEFFMKNSFGVRVGIGSGSQCLTTINTGIGRPQFNALVDVYEDASKIKEIYGNKIYVINDGGIKNHSDIAVALLFSDFIMSNYLFKNTALNIFYYFSPEKDKVIHYGMASKYAKDKEEYIEGDMTQGKRENIEVIKKNIKESLQSTLSYCNVLDIKDFDYKNLQNTIELVAGFTVNMKLQDGIL